MNTEISKSVRQYDASLPLESAATIPALWYTDPEIAHREQHDIFARGWQYVGRVAQLQEPGDFITESICGHPVLVTRNAKGALQAFSNVCRHRAARVECRQHGKAKRFRCRYHGWAYDLNGRLCGTPDFEGVKNFVKEENPLPQFHVATWEPFVFVNMSDQPESFEQFTAPLETYRDAMSMDSLQFHSRIEWELRCNWKVFIDNYQDGGYHINTLHPGLARVVDMNTYDTELFDRASLQLSPLREAAGNDAANLNSVRSGSAAYYWWYYPNLMINVYDKVMDVNIVQPIDANRCRVIFDFFFDPTVMKNDVQFVAESLKVSQQVQDEDIEICEEVQRNLATGSFHTGRFSVRREAGAHLFHNLVAKSLQRSM